MTDVGSSRAQQAMQRDAELNLPLQIHDAGQNRVGAVRNSMHGPGQGDLGDWS